MFRRLIGCIGEYKKLTIMTPLLMVGEVIIECLIPFFIADLINQIKAGCPMSDIYRIGGILFLMAVFSLTFGGLAGFTAAKASAGFAKNLRQAIFYKTQDFAFENIDKFSSASLVTRMTTDVGNVQIAFMN